MLITGRMGYIDSIQENSSGHKKKLLFFIDRLESLRREKKLEAAEIQVLDVGCGNGTKMTLPIGERGYSLIGIDFHEPSIRYAKQTNRLANVEFAVEEASALAKMEQKYDAVLFADILEHVEEPEQLLQDARSMLEPDGMVLICIPNGYGPYEVEDFLFRSGPLRVVFKMVHSILRVTRMIFGKSELNVEAKTIPYNRESGHVQFFTMRKIKGLIHETGFDVTSFQKGSFITGPLTHAIFKRSARLLKWNLGLAHHLPAFLCSTWFFECRPNESCLSGEKKHDV